MIHQSNNYDFKFSLLGSAKRGNNHMISSVKALKVNGSVLSLNMSQSSRHLVVGSDQGYVSVYLLF